MMSCSRASWCSDGVATSPGGEPAPDSAPGSSDISEEEVSALLEKTHADAVRPFDFAAQRINRTQLPMLQIIGKSFAERAKVALSGLLSRDATVEFTSVDSIKAADLQASLPSRAASPSCV